MSLRPLRNFALRAALPAALLAASACGGLDPVLRQVIDPPSVDLTGARLTALSFDRADLEFRFRLDNPNDVGLDLAGVGYTLNVNGERLLTGDRDDRLRLQANGGTAFELPVSVRFDDVYRTLGSLGGRERSTYEIETEFRFDVPVLGTVRVPVTQSGELPLLRAPKLSFGGLRLKSLSPLRADLELALDVENPNAFALVLRRLDYRLEVGGRNWVSGAERAEMSVAEEGSSTFVLPISAEPAAMGLTLFQALAGGGPLDVRMSGRAELSGDEPLPSSGVELPFDFAGELRAAR